MNRKTTTLLILLFSTSLFSPFLITQASASPNVTAVFAFGDSTIDPGNNNHLFTLFRGNHPPYGRDFPNHVSTGRFSNGKLSTDYLVSQLGIKDVLPAYLDPALTTLDLLTGVSFASAGTGLDSMTATIASALRMSTQLDNFDRALARIRAAVGPQRARYIINNAIFVISIGTNDLIYNYYDLPTRRQQYPSVSAYHDFLLSELQSVIQRLYNAGARRFAVGGLPPIGCLPLQVTIGSFMPSPHMLRRVCVEQQNTDSIAYNNKLRALTSRLQNYVLGGAKVAYLDMYYPLLDMIYNPARYGFDHTLQGCCGMGTMEMGPLCDANTETCSDPSKYIFWDAVHPTQATYWILSQIASTTVLPQLLS